MIHPNRAPAVLLMVFCVLASVTAPAQSRREEIHTDLVLYQKRVVLEKDLRERIIGRTFSMPLDSSTEDRYLSACWALSQFLFYSPDVEAGLSRLFAGYGILSYDTRRAFMEAVYAVAPQRFAAEAGGLLEEETDARLYALCAVYCYRCDTGTENTNHLMIRMVEKFPGYDTIPVLRELQQYLSYHAARVRAVTPAVSSLFSYQPAVGQKIIFSFQRWDRNYPGMAVVMDEKGHFVRDGQGRLQLFRQLARSGPDLPYFITNGSTPQGIYCITGTGVSRTNFIGPTPNLQMIMPFEESWDRYFYTDSVDVMGAQGPGVDSLTLYRALLPPDWRDYPPMMEAWSAGRIGRTEIIAHGTTIDPEYFKDRPFYPLTPTMGCLCAKELWNPTSGHLLVSEQFNLISAFLSTPGRKGYLYVINLDDQRRPVSREEIEALVRKWEHK